MIIYKQKKMAHFSLSQTVSAQRYKRYEIKKNKKQKTKKSSPTTPAGTMKRTEQNFTAFFSSRGKQEDLLCQLRHYQRQNERLQHLNGLYQRLAGAPDLPTMVEAYSIWLSEHLPHDLIGYHHPGRQRTHLFCSSHGPKRRSIIETAEQIFAKSSPNAFRSHRLDNLYACRWSIRGREEDFELLLLLEEGKGEPGAEEMELLNTSVEILSEPLQRALGYEEIIEQARKDTLTGLPNRLALSESLDGMIERACRYDHPLTLVALDLDHFKEVNDYLGHPAGDRVLQEVARALSSEIRLSDLLVRMGGDEFLLVLQDTEMQAARKLGERLCQAVAKLNIRAGNKKLGVSIGLCQWQAGVSRDKWLEQADDILYQAKKNGRSQVAVQ